MIRAVAVDDEPMSLSIIETFAAKTPFVDLKASFTDPWQLINYLAAEKIDLLFLDVQMPDLNGFEVIKSLQRKPLVIFVTAFTDYAVDSYEQNAVDYLLKPFSLARFTAACNKASDRIQKGQENQFDYTFIKSGYEQIKINFDDILYIESKANYVIFTLTQQQYISRMTLNDVITLLSPQNFIRIHRCFIVNKNKISRFNKQQLFIDNYVLPVGLNYQKSLNGLS